MCIRADLFKKIRFDDITFHGFHCYDSDICMQILQSSFEIAVTYGILVQHKVYIELDSTYYEAIKAWHQKWKESLPVVKGVAFNDNEIKRYTSFVANHVELERQVAELKKVYQTRAYRLGRGILRPYKFLKNLFR